MENTEYRWKNIDANNEGYTDKFECPGCGTIIHRKSTMKDNDWTYCPVCGHKNNKKLLPYSYKDD